MKKTKFPANFSQLIKTEKTEAPMHFVESKELQTTQHIVRQIIYKTTYFNNQKND